MRAVVDVDTAFVDQTTYAEFVMSLSNPCSAYQFTPGPSKGQAIIDIAMPLVFAFVDRIFGGKGSSQGVDARTVSQIEMGVLHKILKRMVEDLESTWEPILRVEISDIEFETNPEFMQITAASEIVILLAFEVNSTNASGLVSLCYPYFTLYTLLERMGQQTYQQPSAVGRELRERDNRLRLGSMQLPVVTQLGQTELSVAQAEGLRPGDVIRSSAQLDDPAVICVGSKPKYLAYPFAADDGEVRLKVAKKIPPEDESRYA